MKALWDEARGVLARSADGMPMTDWIDPGFIEELRARDKNSDYFLSRKFSC